MNRRKVLAFIGISPLLPFSAKASEPDSCVMTPAQVDNAFRQQMAQFGNVLVCENHPDKAWPEECDCGPGMRYSDAHKA